jgi:hypothetical protein
MVPAIQEKLKDRLKKGVVLTKTWKVDWEYWLQKKFRRFLKGGKK